MDWRLLRRGSCAAGLLLSGLPLGCATLAGVDEDYYLASGGRSGVSGSSGAGEGGASGTAGAAGGGAAGSAGSGGEGPLALPAGRLVYHSYTDYSNYDSEMYVVELPSGERLLDVVGTLGLCSPLSGSFSPDGRYLAVASDPGEGTCTGDLRSWYEIFVIDLDAPTGVPMRITENGVPDEDPHFGPDGQTLYFKHDNHLAYVQFPPSQPFNDCSTAGGFCFNHGGGEQSKPVVSPDGNRIFYHEASGVAADVFCFPLSQRDQAMHDHRIDVATTPNLGEARPAIFGEFIYYVRHWSSSNLNNLIVRQPLNDLGGDAEETAGFVRGGQYDYADPAALTGALMVYSTDESASGSHDLFVAEFASDTGVSIDELLTGSNTINGNREELGASFHPVP